MINPVPVNANEEFFGEERLVDVIKRFQDDSAEKLIEAIISSVEAHSGNSAQTDDVTLVVIKRKGN